MRAPGDVKKDGPEMRGDEMRRPEMRPEMRMVAGAHWSNA